MARRKPSKIFVVDGPGKEQVVVLARHAKGARTIAAQHIDGLTVANSTVSQGCDSLKRLAVNGETT